MKSPSRITQIFGVMRCLDFCVPSLLVTVREN